MFPRFAPISEFSPPFSLPKLGLLSGWLPVPRRARTAQFRAARELPTAPAREGAGGSIYPGARMGALLYE